MTAYKLFFPEKRQFFLKNAGAFDFASGGDSGDLLFFSRNIGIDPITGQDVPINGGGKVTGSIDGFELGAMDENGTLWPQAASNFSVAFGSFQLVLAFPDTVRVASEGYSQHSGSANIRLWWNYRPE